MNGGAKDRRASWTRLFTLLSVVTGVACGGGHDEPPPKDDVGTQGSAELSVDRQGAPVSPTAQGTWRGTRDGRTFAFKGIRYGEKPVRFAPPVAAAPFAGTKDAMAYGATCFQRIERTPKEGADAGAPTFETIGEEDCLFLNVWTPADLREGERVPVLFFIHGGGLTTGGSYYNPWFYYGTPGVTDLYDGKLVAERGRVTVVTLNYRLGAMGYTSHPALTNAGGTSGNLGLEDMTLALQWVQKNIATFGGDPGNVMVFGESGGAYATCALMTSPRGKGLFTRAGMESEFCIARSKADNEAAGRAFADRLGCSSAPDVAACMRSKPKEDIALAQGVAPAGLPSEKTLQFIPTVDGAFLPEHPMARIRGKRHNAMPVLWGGNAKEASLIKLQPGVPDTWAEVRAMFDAPELAKEAAVLKAFYSAWNFPTPQDAVVAFGTDTFMTCPLRQQARILAASQTQPVHRYVFDADVPAYLGALGNFDSFHGSELFYVFQNLLELPYGTPNLSQLALEGRMLGYWTSFAREGRPSTPANLTSPLWLPQAAGGDNAMFLGEVTAMVGGYHGPACDAFDRLMPPAY